MANDDPPIGYSNHPEHIINYFPLIVSLGVGVFHAFQVFQHHFSPLSFHNYPPSRS